MQRLEDLRFLFVTGKGGVGKSTVAASLGLWLSSLGRRVLVAFPHGALGQERLWGRRIGSTEQRVRHNLSVVAIEPNESMQEYARAVLHSRALADAVFKSKLARGFLEGVPGLAAWSLLGKAWFYATGGGAHAPHAPAPPFDTVIFDGPATGHGTDILRVPQVILDLSPRGRFRDDAAACMEMLKDPQKSAVVPVTLLEDLPVTETEELVQLVRSDLELPLGPVMVNQRIQPLFSESERVRLADRERARMELPQETLQEEAQGRGNSVERTLSAAGRRAIREQTADQLVDRLKQLNLPLVELPELADRPEGLDSLGPLSEALARGVQGGYRP